LHGFACCSCDCGLGLHSLGFGVVTEELDLLLRRFFLNHYKDVVHKCQLGHIRLRNVGDVYQTVLVFSGILEKMNVSCAGNAEKLHVFLEGKSNDLVFLDLLGDGETFDLLQVVALGHILGLQVDFLHLEIVKDAQHFAAQEEIVNEPSVDRQLDQLLLDPLLSHRLCVFRWLLVAD